MTTTQAIPGPTARFFLEITLLEDLHAGSGLGGAGVDALLARDRLGRPVIRWSHVKGLLIEALHERCEALGGKAEPFVRRLFGESDNRGRSQGSVRGRSLRATNLGSVAAGAIVWSSTARKRGTRVPLDDTLRRIEFVRAGTVFAGEVRVPGQIDGEDATLVGKLLARLSRLGGGRSRGAGLVHIEVTPSPLPPVQLSMPAQAMASGAQGPCELRVMFRGLEPLCLAATGQPRNLIPSHSHLAPGTVAGMLAHWALDHGAPQLAEFIIDGRIVCGPGYPFPHELGKYDLERIDSVSIPLSLQSPKPSEQTGALPWWAAEPQASKPIDDLARSDDERRSEKLKRPAPHDYLVTADGTQWQLYACSMGESLRNDAGRSQRHRGKQNLFSVQEIAEDTGFIARIVARGPDERESLLAALKALKEGGHWLHAGRGGAPLAVEAYASAAGRDASNASENNAKIRVYVESDLILRAPDLRFRTRLDRAAVQALLEAAGVDPEATASLAEVEQVSEPFTVRGWNAATGSRRLPAVAIRRGSVAILKFSDPAAAHACRAALNARGRFGLGERALEGYGRIRVDFAPSTAGKILRAAETPRRNEAEDVLVQSDELMKGIPTSFTPSHWQALRDAAGNKALLDAWFDQAARRAKKKDESANNWLGKLRKHEAHAGMLRALGLAAAKKAKRERRTNQSGGE